MNDIAVFWDESFLWGLITFWSLQSLKIPFDLLTAKEIIAGSLDSYDLLIVPGGWASQKSARLGAEGRSRIKSFVHTGGSFLGFCGGAGVALDVRRGLGLLPVKRKSPADRLVNFSGTIIVTTGQPRHPFWSGLRPPFSFHVWWPSQFDIENDNAVKVIASYNDVGADFRVADLLVKNVRSWGNEWEKWERAYGIRLNPESLMNEPSAIEGKFGKGTVVLSYLHLDTPDDKNGNMALKNLCNYLMRVSRKKNPNRVKATPSVPCSAGCIPVNEKIVSVVKSIRQELERFVEMGCRNLFWSWRNPWLFNWKRGLRGLEYNTLAILGREFSKQVENLYGAEICTASGQDWVDDLKYLDNLIRTFVHKASTLLEQERFLMENSSGPLKKLMTNHPGVDQLRDELFGDKMSFGGTYRKLIDYLDSLLFPLLQSKTFSKHNSND